LRLAKDFGGDPQRIAEMQADWVLKMLNYIDFLQDLERLNNESR